MKKMAYACLLVCGLVLTACSGGQEAPAPVAAEDVALKIGVLKIDDSLPLYVADQEQLFAKYGVDVELVEFGSASDQAKVMEAGSLDGMMTDMVVQSLIKKGGVDLRTVALAFGADASEGRFMVLVAPDSGITTVEGLYGQTVGISENTMMEYLLTSYEKELGLDGTQIRKLHIPNLSLRVDALLKGSDIQAAILPDPLASYAAAMGAIPVIDDTQLGVNLSQSVIVLTQEQLTNNPEAAAKFIQGYNEAIQMINENPEAYRDLIVDVARIPENIKDSYTMPTYTAGGLPSAENVAAIEAWLVDKGLLSAPYAYDEMVNTQLNSVE